MELASEAVLVRVAAELARAWRDRGLGGWVVGLRGPLGSGKTTWVRAMLRGLGYTGRVPSPTYTLLEEYRVAALTLVHVDLYRIADAAEAEYLGIRDRVDAPEVWTLIEWPERAPAVLERADLLVDLTPRDGARTVELTAVTRAGRAAAAALSEIDFK